MWRRPDGKQKYGTAGHKVLPSPDPRLADISSENPNPLYKARSGFSILTEECLTFRTTSPPLRRVLADAHQENTIICFVPDHACMTLTVPGRDDATAPFVKH